MNSTTSPKNTKSTRILLILFYLSAFLFLFTTAASRLDPDLGWHLRVGQDIIEQQKVIHIETYTYPTYGEEWIDHEWLGNVLLYVIYDASPYGYWTLCALFSLLVLGIFLSITLYLSKNFIPKDLTPSFLIWSIPLQIASLFVIGQYHGIRLQELSWAFFALWLILFTHYLKTHNKKILLLFPVALFVWTNLHGTFVLGFFLLSIFCAYIFLFDKRSKEYRIFIIASWLLALLSTFLTPHTWKLWYLVAIEYSQSTYYLTHIQEWLPLYVFPPFLLEEFLYLSFVIAALLMLFIFKSEIFKRQPHILLISFFFLFFLYFSVQQRRNISLFIFLVYPILLYLLSYCVIIKASLLKKNFLLTIAIYITLLCVSVALLAKISLLPKNPMEEKFPGEPFGAVEFIKNNEEVKNKRIFNQYGWGGYLDWNWKEKQLFIDGRMPQRPLENDISYLEEYELFFKKDSMEEQFDKHAVELVLLRKDHTHFSQIQTFILAHAFNYDVNEYIPKNENIISYLSNHWTLVYEDDDAWVYSR